MKREINILSLGAGVQSSTMLLMITHGQLPRPDYIIFSDTGWEPASVYAWLQFLKDQIAPFDLEIITVEKGNIKQDIEAAALTGGRFSAIPYFIKNEDGSQGLGMRHCTRDYKIDPKHKYIRSEILNLRPRQRVKVDEVHINLWFGITTDESRRVKVAKEKWMSNIYPLIEMDMDRADCIKWMNDHGYPTPPKSACVCCPYRKNEEWARMKKHDPASFVEAVEFDQLIRKGMRGLNGEAFLHRSLQPLGEVDFSTFDDLDELNMFQFDCEGMCGV